MTHFSPPASPPPSAPALPAFAPVPLRPRHDGFGPDRQALFIRTLAETGRVSAACKAAGVSRDAAYAARRRPEAASFAAAWDAALTMAVQLIADLAVEHALDGEVIPVYYKGELVGERIRRDTRLWTFLLSAHDPARYGRQARELPDRLKAAGKGLRSSLAALQPPGGGEE